MADISSASDSALIELSRAGDRTAFGELWQRHSRAALTVARSFTSLDADDVVAEAFAKVFSAIRGGGGPTGAFRPYLFTTVRNVASSWGRVQQPVQVEDADAFEDPTTSEDEVLASLDRSTTARAFRSLPTRWQEVLWYTEVEAMSPRHVAPLLGMKPNAVAALAVRAREGLRQAWISVHLSSKSTDPECRSTVERLAAYARGSLGARATAQVAEHLDGCAQCQIVAEEAAHIGSRIALVMLPLAAGLTGAGVYLAALQHGAGAAAVAAGAAGGAGLGGGSVSAGASAHLASFTGLPVAGAAGSASAGSGAVGGAAAAGGAGAGAAGGGGGLAAGAIVGIAAAAVAVLAGAGIALAVTLGPVWSKAADAGTTVADGGAPAGDSANGSPSDSSPSLIAPVAPASTATPAVAATPAPTPDAPTARPTSRPAVSAPAPGAAAEASPASTAAATPIPKPTPTPTPIPTTSPTLTPTPTPDPTPQPPEAPAATLVAGPTALSPVLAGVSAEPGATITATRIPVPGEPAPGPDEVETWTTTADAAGAWTLPLDGLRPGASGVTVTQSVTDSGGTLVSPAGTPVAVVLDAPPALQVEEVIPGWIYRVTVVGTPGGTFQLAHRSTTGVVDWTSDVFPLDAAGTWNSGYLWDFPTGDFVVRYSDGALRGAPGYATP